MADDITISVGLDSTGLEQGKIKVVRSLNEIRESAKRSGTQGIDRFQSSINRLTSVTIQNSKQLSKFNKRITTVRKSSGGAAKEIGGLQKIMFALQKTSRVIDGPLGGVAARFETLGSVARSGSKDIIKFIAVIGGVGLALTALIKSGERLTILQNKLRLVTTGSENLALIQEKLFAIANKARVSIDATVDLFSRFARATRDLDISQAKLLSVTESVSKAVAISGSTAQSAAAALFQLGQGLAADALRGQELNSVLEQTPRVARAIADGLGVTIGRLRELSKEGKLTAEVVLNAINSQKDVLENEFAKTIVTLSQGFVKLQNTFLKWTGSLNQSTGVTRILSNLLSKLADNLETILNVLVGGGLLFAFKTLITLTFTLSKSLFVAGAAMLAFTKRAAAIGALTAILAAFTSPVLVALGAVTALGVALVALTDILDPVINSIKVLSKLLVSMLPDFVLNGFKQLSGFFKDIFNQDVSIQAQVAQLKLFREELTLLAETGGGSGEKFKGLQEKINLLSGGLLIQLEKQAEKESKLNLLGRQRLRFLIQTNKSQEEISKQQLISIKLNNKLKETFLLIKNVQKSRIPLSKEQIEADKEQAKFSKILLDIENKFPDKAAEYLEKLKEINFVKASGNELSKKQLKSIELAENSALEALDKIEKKQIDLFIKKNPLAESFKKVGESITKTLTDSFKTIVTEGKVSFKSLGESIKNIFADVAASIAKKRFFEPIGNAIFSGLSGAAGLSAPSISSASGSGGGSLLSLGSSFFSGGSSLTEGLSGTVASFLNNAGFGNAVGPISSGIQTAGTFAGAAGGIGGNLLGNALFGDDRGIGTTIGSTIGTVIGASIGGPIGAFVGSTIGNFVGGLFGGGASSKISEFSGGLTSTGIDATFGQKGSSTKFAEGLSKAVGGFSAGLNSLTGVNIAGINVRGGSDTKQGSGFRIDGGQRIDFDPTNQDSVTNALGRLAVELLRVGEVTNESVITALQNIQTEGRSVDEILSDIGFAAAFENLDFVPEKITALEKALETLNEQFDKASETAIRLGLDEQKLTDARETALAKLRTDFDKGIQEAILSVSNPLALSLKQLNAQFIAATKDAITIGGNVVEVERLFALKRQNIIESSLGTVNDMLQVSFDAAETMAKNAANNISNLQNSLTNIQGFRDSLELDLRLGGTNRLGRLEASREQFNRVANRVASGDVTALDEIEKASTSFLQASVDYYGETADHIKNLTTVKTLLSSAESLALNSISVEERILQENEAQTKLLSELTLGTTENRSGGFSEALGRVGGVSSSQILRSGETLQTLQNLTDGITGLPLALSRRLKVSASEGGFNFSSSQGSFADFVKSGNTGAGQLFLELTKAFGGSGLQNQASRFFANGTGNASVSSGLAVVGERGPELVNFGRPAQVISNDGSNALMGAKETANEVRQYRRQSEKETIFLGEKLNVVVQQIIELKDEISGFSRAVEA